MDGVLAGRNEGLGAWGQGLGFGDCRGGELQASNQDDDLSLKSQAGCVSPTRVLRTHHFSCTDARPRSQGPAAIARDGRIFAQAEGPLITLPYCWFSAIDTWDNPSLCAVDTYDLSGDEVKFRSRLYNRPDLVPIAKAIEYAEKRDYPAVLGYCVSADLAHRLVRDLPSDIGAEDLRVIRTGNGKERVEFGDSGYRFDVERRGDRWVVVAFGIN